MKNKDGVELRYINHYRHCGTEWTDIWDCQCNDRCPCCDREIEPYYSEDFPPPGTGDRMMLIPSDVPYRLADMVYVPDHMSNECATDIAEVALEQAAEACGERDFREVYEEMMVAMGFRWPAVIVDGPPIEF